MTVKGQWGSMGGAGPAQASGARLEVCRQEALRRGREAAGQSRRLLRGRDPNPGGQWDSGAAVVGMPRPQPGPLEKGMSPRVIASCVHPGHPPGSPTFLRRHLLVGCGRAGRAELRGRFLCRSRCARVPTGQAWRSWSSRSPSTTSCRRRSTPTGSSCEASWGRWVNLCTAPQPRALPPQSLASPLAPGVRGGEGWPPLRPPLTGPASSLLG